MSLDEAINAHRSPWQNPFVEGLIRSTRRKCLDHMIVFNEAHLIRILTTLEIFAVDSVTASGPRGGGNLPRGPTYWPESGLELSSFEVPTAATFHSTGRSPAVDRTNCRRPTWHPER